MHTTYWDVCINSLNTYFGPYSTSSGANQAHDLCGRIVRTNTVCILLALRASQNWHSVQAASLENHTCEREECDHCTAKAQIVNLIPCHKEWWVSQPDRQADTHRQKRTKTHGDRGQRWTGKRQTDWAGNREGQSSQRNWKKLADTGRNRHRQTQADGDRQRQIDIARERHRQISLTKMPTTRVVCTFKSTDRHLRKANLKNARIPIWNLDYFSLCAELILEIYLSMGAESAIGVSNLLDLGRSGPNTKHVRWEAWILIK